MQESNIIQLRLNKEEFKHYTSTHNYSTEFITIENYVDYTDTVADIISLMNRELVWNGIPDYELTVERFKAGSKCILWIYNDRPIGWAWSNDKVTFDWINHSQELNPDELYGGGAFLSRSINRPSDAGLAFYSLTFKHWFEDLNKTTIFQYSDNWNRVSTILSMKCGFKNFKFLN